jgi:hypothetical protein
MLSTLMDDMKNAMKSGNKDELAALRNLIGKVKAKKIDKGEELTSDETLKIIITSAKQLKDSIQQYEKGGRSDLVEKESFELSIVERYLPQQMSEDEVQQIVSEVIAEVGATTMKDMGKVMGGIMKRVAGQADGNLIQQLVRKELN